MHDGPGDSYISRQTFLKTATTLKKLKERGVIPKNQQYITLNTTKIHYPSGSTHEKYLLMTKSSIIYYGTLNDQGKPKTKDGVCILSDGSYYEGEFHDGKISGKGVLTNLEESYRYEGLWEDGLPHGQGKQTIGKNEYAGNFYQGKKHGYGKMKFADESHYEGNFNMNTIQGQGKYFNKNHFWDGNWKDGYLQGKGKQIIAKNSIEDLTNSSEYVGNFVKGERSGYGSFVWNGKYEYEGEFKNGQLDGEGIFKFKGKVYAGTWAKGTELRISQLKKEQQK